MRLSLKPLVVVLSLLSSCTTLEVPNPLSDQILKPRLGFKNALTNRTCLEEGPFGCKRDKIEVYDLKSDAFRKTINDMNFICNVGGKRFKVCMDKPGFCRITSVKTCKWFKCTEVAMVSEFIGSDDDMIMVALNIRCFRPALYPELEP